MLLRKNDSFGDNRCGYRKHPTAGDVGLARDGKVLKYAHRYFFTRRLSLEGIICRVTSYPSAILRPTRVGWEVYTCRWLSHLFRSNCTKKKPKKDKLKMSTQLQRRDTRAQLLRRYDQGNSRARANLRKQTAAAVTTK